VDLLYAWIIFIVSAVWGVKHWAQITYVNLMSLPLNFYRILLYLTVRKLLSLGQQIQFIFFIKFMDVNIMFTPSSTAVL
jgi:hypothetical protein